MCLDSVIEEQSPLHQKAGWENDSAKVHVVLDVKPHPCMQEAQISTDVILIVHPLAGSNQFV